LFLSAFCLVAAQLLFCGCIRPDRYEGYKLVIDVRSKTTGQPLDKWTIEALRVLNTGWNTHDAPRKIETTLLRVLSQDPLQNTYDVEPFTAYGLILIPPLGYGGWKTDVEKIYAVGYEIQQRIASQEVLEQATDAKGAARKQVQKLTYALEPWNNDLSNLAVDDFLATLKDRKNFAAYEALRGKPKGSGVPALYQYYVARYEAIRAANPAMRADPAVEETVAWLRQAATGGPSGKVPASPTVTRHEMSGMSRERIIRVVPRDAETGEGLKEWVVEVVLLALTQTKPEGEFHKVLSVDRRTSEAPESRVPAFTHTQEGPKETIQFLDVEAVYVVGYEPLYRPTEEKYDRNVEVVQYALKPWGKADAQEIRRFAQLLENEERFRQYEKLRQTDRSGVPALYRYFLARYDALGQSTPRTLSPKARARIDWIRNLLEEGG
jgi:hypothetical protein